MRITLAHEETRKTSERQHHERAVNLFVDAQLLDEARRLIMMIRAAQEKRRPEENWAAIASFNGFIDEHDCWQAGCATAPSNEPPVHHGRQSEG